MCYNDSIGSMRTVACSYFRYVGMGILTEMGWGSGTCSLSYHRGWVAGPSCLQASAPSCHHHGNHAVSHRVNGRHIYAGESITAAKVKLYNGTVFLL